MARVPVGISKAWKPPEHLSVAANSSDADDTFQIESPLRYFELGQEQGIARSQSKSAAREISALLRLRLEALFQHLADGALVKRAVLRLFHRGSTAWKQVGARERSGGVKDGCGAD